MHTPRCRSRFADPICYQYVRRKFQYSKLFQQNDSPPEHNSARIMPENQVSEYFSHLVLSVQSTI